MTSTPYADALGSINPRVTDTKTLMSWLNDLEVTPSRFTTPITVAPLPSACIDGRPVCPSEFHDRRLEAPRAVGGTLTIWVADLLVTQKFRPHDLHVSDDVTDSGESGETLEQLTPPWLSVLCACICDSGATVGMHSDEHATHDNCGCGAIDNLRSSLALIAQMPESLVGILHSWGIDPELIDAKMRQLCAQWAMTVPSGDSIAGIMAGYSATPPPVLQGDHLESAVLVNFVEGTTVDVATVTQAFPKTEETDPSSPNTSSPTDLQFFVCDAWCFSSVADFLTRDIEDAVFREQQRLRAIAAAAAVNAATMLILVGSQMPMALLHSDASLSH